MPQAVKWRGMQDYVANVRGWVGQSPWLQLRLGREATWRILCVAASSLWELQTGRQRLVVVTSQQWSQGAPTRSF